MANPLRGSFGALPKININVIAAQPCQTVEPTDGAKHLDLELEANSAFEDGSRTLGKQIGLKRREQFNALKTILMNFAVWNHSKPLLVSRAKRSVPKRYNPSRMGYKALISAQDALKKFGLIEKTDGQYNLDEGRGVKTVIRSSEGLRSRMAMLGMRGAVLVSPDAEVVILKAKRKGKSKKKHRIDYPDTSYTQRVRAELRAYNALLSATDIETEDEPFENYLVKRIFNNDNFAMGGRLSAPWGHGGLTREKRQTIAIDGEETVELDFPASHLNIIYRMETGQPYPGGDAYDVVIKGKAMDGKTRRGFVKQYCTIALNTSSTTSASGAYLTWLNEQSGEKQRQWRQLGIAPVDIYRAIIDKHPLLERHYLKGEHGLTIQHRESELVCRIIKEFTDREIPVLTVHDSIIVAERHEGLVQQLMRDTPLPCVEHELQSGGNSAEPPQRPTITIPSISS